MNVMFQLGVHVLRALSQDDRATPNQQPDGFIDILAADARLSMRHYGHLYLAASEVASHHARAVSDVIQILNAPGGSGLISPDYFGPNSQGGGKRTTRGHYDVPMRDCTVTLDNKTVIERGRLVDSNMIVERVQR